VTRHLGRAAGLVAIGALQFYWYWQPAGFALKPLTAVFTVICLASPTAGLLAFAALAPVSSTIEFLGGGVGIGGGLMLEQLVLALGTGALVRFGESGVRTRIGRPALFLAVVALASAAAMLPAAAAATAPPGIENDTSAYLRLLLNRRNAYNSAAWSPVFAAIMVAECSLLGWVTERTIRRTPDLATRLITVSLAGHAAAALLNIQWVVRMSEALGGGLEGLREMLRTARLSMQMDVHAAGSALLLAGVAGVGLVGHSRVRNIAVAMLLAIVTTGLWITGSRVAIALGGVAAVIVLVAWGIRSFNRRTAIAGAGAIAIAAGVWLALYPSVRYSTTSVSTQSRLLMAKAGFELFDQAPIFGIGISRFYAESAAVVSPEMVQLTGYQRENAHNNFIQVLAEQGLVGFVALLLWLGVVLWAGWRAQSVRPDRARACLLLALVICIGTWTMGHPMLVREFSVVFWLYAGILVAMTPPPLPSRWNLAWPAFAGLVILSVPVRANALRDSAELDHLGFGLSVWQHDDDRRYRDAAARFAVYLPANGASMAVPVRRTPGAVDPIVVEARIAGRVVQTISLADDAWHEFVIEMPRQARRFERVDFAAKPPDSPPSTPRVVLRVGFEQAR